MKRIICFTLIICAMVSVKAQNFLTDVKAMNKWLLETSEIHLGVDVTLKTEKGEEIYKDQSQVHRVGKEFFTVQGETQLVMNEDYLLLIDEEKKQITCNEIDKKMRKQMKNYPTIPDSLFDQMNVTFKALSQGKKQYTVLLEEGGYEQVIIELDQENRPFRFVYLLSEELSGDDGKLTQEVKFSTIKAIPMSHFDTKYYLSSTKKDNLQPSKQFSDFTIIHTAKEL